MSNRDKRNGNSQLIGEIIMRAISSVSARSLLLLILSAALTSCTASKQETQVSPRAPVATGYANTAPGVTPSGFRLPSGKGCAGAVARWAAIQDNDLKTGHVTKSVYNKIQNEITEARTVCNAGREAQAIGLVRASRVRHGYPAG